MTTNLYDLESLKNMQFVTTIYDHKGKKATTLGDAQREDVESAKFIPRNWLKPLSMSKMNAFTNIMGRT